MRTLLLIIVLLICGCGGKVGVSGKVSYPDGSPVMQGFVIFESGTYQVFGAIDEGGNYRMGEHTSGAGIKSGTYKVRVESRTGGGSDGAPLVRFVAEKYESADTSGLTCEVNGKTEFDITVEKP